MHWPFKPFFYIFLSQNRNIILADEMVTFLNEI